MSFAKDSSWICQFPISLAIEGGSCYENMGRTGIGRLLFCTVIYSPYRLVMPATRSAGYTAWRKASITICPKQTVTRTYR